MLGYNRPLQGIANQFVGIPDASAYFSNLRVVSLARPAITGVTDTRSGTNNAVAVKFLSNDGDDTAASFALQSSGTNGVLGAYADVTAATITQVLSTNTTAAFFQATVTVTNAAQVPPHPPQISRPGAVRDTCRGVRPNRTPRSYQSGPGGACHPLGCLFSRGRQFDARSK